MKLVDEKMSQEIFKSYKEELFIFNETYDMLKDKHVVRLYKDDIIVCIGMYSKLDAEEIELYLTSKQQKAIGQVLSNGIYLDSIYSFIENNGYATYIINYLEKKFNEQAIWCYSASTEKARKYWGKKFISCGENIFVNKLKVSC